MLLQGLTPKQNLPAAACFADLVVTAMQEGRDAAASIARALRGLKAIPALLALT